MIRLIVADDQELVREGIAAILEAEPDIEVVGSAADGAEALGLVHAVQPDVALIDIRMPEIDGVEATRRIVQGGSATRVLILTTFATDANVVGALRAGASGFLLKDAPKSSLLSAVRALAAGLSNEQIAAKVFLSSNTVKTHIARTLTKLEARDRIHLVILAHTHGLA